MRVVIFTLAVLLNCNLAVTQEKELKTDLPVRDPITQNLNTEKADKISVATFAPIRRTEIEKAAVVRPLAPPHLISI